MDKFEYILSLMTEEDLLHLKNKVAKNSLWKVYFPKYQKFGFKDRYHIRDFWLWYRERKSKTDIKSPSKPPPVACEKELLHTHQYWYDESRDTYVVHIPSKKKPFALKGSFWRQIKEAYSNWGGGSSTINEVCRKFSISRTTLTALLRAMGMTHDSPPWSDQYIKSASEDELVEDLLRRKEENVLVRAQKIEWEAVKRDAYKYRRWDLFARSIKSYFESIRHKPVVLPTIELEKSSNPYMLIVSPTDFHWGKYAPEYSGDPYNRKIARERLFSLTSNLINRLKHRGKPEIIYVGIGGDGLHIDNQGKTTTHGTPQDCDGTPSELISTYVSICKDYILFLTQLAPVKLFVLPGNHDYYSSCLLREALKGWFHHHNDIEVFDCTSNRQTVLYGKSLLTFMHGDDGKVKDYPAIIAAENAIIWGMSKWRFVFTGHLHTERELPTFGDVTVYRMPSLAGTDDWHHRKGYRSRKALIGYIVDKEEGVIGTEICPVVL